MTPLASAALAFATAAHASIDQRRRFTGEPYIVHPTAVAEIVRSVPHDDAMVAAAYLHDVVEDVAPRRAAYGLAEIARRFGADVAELVGWLTVVSKPSDGDRPMRLALDRAHLAAAPARAQTIKVADVIDNTRTVRARDPVFARTYLPENAGLLDALVRADPGLRALARRQVA